MNPFVLTLAVREALDFEMAMRQVQAMFGEGGTFDAVLQEAKRRHRETRTTKSLGELVWKVGRERASDKTPS